jgi:hypothetical protein
LIFCGTAFSGNLARPHGLDENSHLFPLGGKVFSANGAISERLNNFELPDQKLVEWVDFGAVFFTLPQSGAPLLGCFKMVLPIRDGSFKRKLSQVPDVGGFSIKSMSLGIGGPLSPPIKQDSEGTDHRSANYPRPGSKESNGLKMLLFFWGHEWRVLALWWGFLTALLIVHLDFIYGAIREILFFRANSVIERPAAFVG